MSSINLKEALQDILPQEEIDCMVRGYDVLGDVAIIIIPETLRHREKEVAEAILRTSPHLRVVAGRDGIHSGEFRTIPLRKIAGTGGLTTLLTEFGIRLHVDPQAVYFSPRSKNERHRIASLVGSGERVLVMFSGIAPLPLMIGRHSEAAEVIGVEKNPEAHYLAVKNLKLNRRIKNVRLLCGDAGEIVPRLQGQFDRIAMPLPLTADKFLSCALDALGAGGWLHYYDFQDKGQFDLAVDTLSQICKVKGRVLLGWKIHKCGHVSPGKYRICVDAKIE